MANESETFDENKEIAQQGGKLLKSLVYFKNTIQEGINSGRADNFDGKKYLEMMKANKKGNGK